MKNSSLILIRTLFILTCFILMITYTVGTDSFVTPWTWARGALLGTALAGSLLGIDLIIKRINLRIFNTVLLGLFLGYMTALLISNLLTTILASQPFFIPEGIIESTKIALLIFGTFVGVMMTLRPSEEIHLSIPFIKFTPATQKSKKILIDIEDLSAGRLSDLASSGLIDNRLVVPRFLLNELHEQEKSSDEHIKCKARHALSTLHKLETLEQLNLQYNDLDFPEEKEITNKISRLGRLLDADVLTADSCSLQDPSITGVRLINLHHLSNALKPLMQRGEYLSIKVQRGGKEERQGVGYLEDGTMVVINGGGDFIGETVKSRVLSVKHSSTGRMIFCNIAEYEE